MPFLDITDQQTSVVGGRTLKKLPGWSAITSSKKKKVTITYWQCMSHVRCQENSLQPYKLSINSRFYKTNPELAWHQLAKRLWSISRGTHNTRTQSSTFLGENIKKSLTTPAGRWRKCTRKGSQTHFSLQKQPCSLAGIISKAFLSG